MNDENLAVAPESGESDTVNVLGSRSTHEFIRYFVASLIALFVDALMLFVLTSLFDVHYLVSAGMAFLCGLAITYTLSIHWVFERRHARAGFEFFVFFVTGLTGLLINELVLWVLTGGLGFYYMVSKIASAGIVFLWNFFARRYVLFR